MVNLLITMRCNRKCSYCFAREKLHSYSRMNHPLDIGMDDFEKVLDLLTEDGCGAMQLAGGEPTLHPQFEEILVRTIGKGLHTNLLSNALWSSDLNQLFSKISPTRMGFLLNVDHPNTYSDVELKTIEENVSALRGRENVSLSFNIFEREPKCEYIFDMVRKHGIRHLRLSFSMPVVFGEVNNEYPPIEDYKALAPFVMDFVKRSERFGASVRMDNTVPICMFSFEQLGELLIDGVLEPYRNFTCFPAIDVGPDLSVWRCFGASGLNNKKLDEFGSLRELYEYYEMVSRPYQHKVFPMDECDECKYARRNLCQGGCIGFSVAKCMETGETPQKTTDHEILEMKLSLRDDVSLKTYEVPDEMMALQHENGDCVEVRPTMGRLLSRLDGKRTLQEIMAAHMNLTEAVDKTGELLNVFLTSTAIEGVVPTIKTLLDREFLVSLDST